MKSTQYLFATIAAGAILMAAQPVFAQDASCTNQYGSSVTCPPNTIVINKKVRYPTNATLFVENLTSNDAAYSAGDEVEYDIAVTNTSAVNYPTVTVIDVFPANTTFVSGPGRYDASENKLTYEISDLKAGTTVHNRILTKLGNASAYPNDLTCDITNTGRVTGPGGQSDEDTARLCVQTRVLGATTLPVAGFDDYAYILPFAALAIIGFGIMAKGAIRP